MNRSLAMLAALLASTSALALGPSRDSARSVPSAYQSAEAKIAKLEAELARLTARLAALERRHAGHTHDVRITEVGMLSEAINGRRVSLAISPRGATSRTGPPTN